MNKKKKEGEGMKKENVHAKHKKSLAERFQRQIVKDFLIKFT